MLRHVQPSCLPMSSAAIAQETLGQIVCNPPASQVAQTVWSSRQRVSSNHPVQTAYDGAQEKCRKSNAKPSRILINRAEAAFCFVGHQLPFTRPTKPILERCLGKAEGQRESQLHILVREGHYGRDEPSLGLRHSVDTSTMQVCAVCNNSSDNRHESSIHERQTRNRIGMAAARTRPTLDRYQEDLTFRPHSNT